MEADQVCWVKELGEAGWQGGGGCGGGERSLGPWCVRGPESPQCILVLPSSGGQPGWGELECGAFLPAGRLRSG